MTVTDTLTGIKNLRFFKKKIKEEMYSAKRYGNNLSLVMLDIDHFKSINDNYGHDIGDTVLVEYTKLISSNLRESDIFSRTGGEEFMIILPHSDIENASNIAEKLRKKIENHKLTVPITMSLGVTEYIKDEDEETFIKRVDDALYKAKDEGRNRVVVG